MIDILFVTKQRNNAYGISVGLLNSANFVANALEEIGIKCQVVTVIDGNSIDREVHRVKPRFVFLEALWVTPAKVRELALKYKSIQWSIRIHSKTPFLAHEGMAFEWITEYKKIIKELTNVRMSSNNLDFNNDMSAVTGIDFDYLPNIYKPKFHKHKDKHKKSESKYIDVACFGAIRPLKNHLEQAIAAIIFADDIGKHLRFHINATRTEQKGDQVLRNLRGLFAMSKKHTLVEHPWVSHKDFVRDVGSMDMGMQVSMSESFNIVTADYIYNELPIVVSEDMDWVPAMYRATPTDTKDIIRTLKFAWDTPFLTPINTMALKWYNYKSTMTWVDHIQRFVSANGAKGVGYKRDK